MRIFVFLLGVIFLAVFSGTYAQDLKKDGDYYELSYLSNDPVQVYNSANLFEKKVGDALKSSYPSKVLDPNISLRVFKKNGQKFYRMVWSCRIVEAHFTDADYYFDRRGTFLSGPTLADAKRKVEAEIEKSDKVSIMRKSYYNAKIPENFIRDSFSGSSTEGYWYVKEFFLVAPK